MGENKMKKNLLVFAISVSLFSVFNISIANADCTASDPCGTWAMLDGQGTVTNVIVCQASVCGGGTWAGQTVVPQVAANPITHDPYGTGSYIGNVEQGTSVSYAEGIFTITENTNITNSFVEVNGENTTTSRVQIPVSQRSFRYEDTIEKVYGEVIMNPVLIDENSLTNVYVKQTNLINTVQESINFDKRKTSEEIRQTFVDNGLNLLISKINVLISLLGTWVK
jgi:hypothetical protein